MTPGTFNAFSAGFMQEMKDVLETKGHDYTSGSEDRLRNFKAIAASIGCSPMLVWYIYFRKHVDSISTFVQHGELKSEPVRGRFMDIANYAILGAALAQDLAEPQE